mgnify:CR=1 FL=1
MYIFKVIGRSIGRATQSVVLGYKEGVELAKKPEPKAHPYEEPNAMSVEV